MVVIWVERFCSLLICEDCDEHVSTGYYIGVRCGDGHHFGTYIYMSQFLIKTKILGSSDL